MRVVLIFSFVMVCCTGCGIQNGKLPARSVGQSNEQADHFDKINDLVSTIDIGISEAQLLETIKPVSKDRGTVYWGGTGARRVYFHVGLDQQVWFELSGPSDGNRVTEIGLIEPKSNWIRDGGDSITVEQPKTAG